MKCLHCAVEIHSSFESQNIAQRTGWQQPIGGRLWSIAYMECPKCEEPLLILAADAQAKPAVPQFYAFPKSTGRQPAAAEIPGHIAEDYHEASAVLKDSPKASAALSRRCLQSMLRDNGYTHKDLAPAIQAVIDSRQLPSAIAENLDAIRNIGNFAAHPLKDTNTGEILPVVPEEAEWNLDVLEELFDFFYVQPEKARRKRAALNAKLVAAGKPEMK